MNLTSTVYKLKEDIKVSNFLDKRAIEKADRFYLYLFWMHVPVFTFFIYIKNNLYWHALISTVLLASIYSISYFFAKGTFLHRVLSGIILMTLSSVLINLTLGQTEQHFHILIFLPTLIAYRDWRVLIPAALWTASHHLIFNYCQLENITSEYWPLVIFKYEQGSEIAYIHIFYVIVEVILLVYFSEVLRREAQVEYSLINNLEDMVKERSSQLLKRNNELTITLNKIKKMQKVIVSNEKLASLGQLSAGVAHEIKNPLHIIKSSKELINDFFIEHSPDDIVKMLKEGKESEIKYFKEDCNDLKKANVMISEGIDRIDNVVKTMVNNSRFDNEEMSLTCIEELITNNLTLTYKSFLAKNGLQINLTNNLHNLPPLNVRQSDIAKAFINIFDNSMYALAKRRETDKKFDPEIEVYFEDNQNETIIFTRDNGVGIPEKHIEKVLQPFFTTKPTNEGTGLGLSLVVDIVQAHGGLVELNSSLNIGTTTKIIFPKNKLEVS